MLHLEVSFDFKGSEYFASYFAGVDPNAARLLIANLESTSGPINRDQRTTRFMEPPNCEICTLSENCLPSLHLVILSQYTPKEGILEEKTQ